MSMDFTDYMALTQLYADVMVEQPDGHRVLLAPDDRVSDLLQQTYGFDEVVIGDVQVIIDDDHWAVTAPGLTVTLTVGGRAGLGWLLRLLPRAGTAPSATKHAGSVSVAFERRNSGAAQHLFAG